MQLLINEIWELEKFETEKLATYIRCVFQAVLPHDGDMALQLFSKATRLVKESAEVSELRPDRAVVWA
jgi:hypothetical protein